MTNPKPCRLWLSIKHLTAAGITLVLALGLSALVPVQAVQAQSYTILHNFGSAIDGSAPSGLTRDKAGNLYGTARGGTYSHGLVFKLNPTGKETVLYNFRETGDGEGPCGGLIRDVAGNLYGTTYGGGKYFFGTLFELDKYRVETILHHFSDGHNDGAQPCARLIRDAEGNLYGTAPSGGNSSCLRGGCGVVFKLGGSRKEVALHIFAGTPDGAVPAAGLIRDKAGNLYGTTVEGGNTNKCTRGCGTVFKLSPSATETVLYRFVGFPDAQYPSGGLIRDAVGNLYGVTGAGGDPNCNCGVVFKLDMTGTLTVLYSFKGGSDGADPAGNLVRDMAGNLYGVTANGGNPNGQGVGTVFKLDPSGVETVLHSFVGAPTDGANPSAGLVRDSAGNLYGTTGAGGTKDSGIAFKLTP
jgi:uncharacterized repeat protein (TIGR03803 family)